MADSMKKLYGDGHLAMDVVRSEFIKEIFEREDRVRERVHRGKARRRCRNPILGEETYRSGQPSARQNTARSGAGAGGNTARSGYSEGAGSGYAGSEYGGSTARSSRLGTARSGRSQTARSGTVRSLTSSQYSSSVRDLQARKYAIEAQLAAIDEELTECRVTGRSHGSPDRPFAQFPNTYRYANHSSSIVSKHQKPRHVGGGGGGGGGGGEESDIADETIELDEDDNPVVHALRPDPPAKGAGVEFTSSLGQDFLDLFAQSNFGR